MPCIWLALRGVIHKVAVTSVVPRIGPYHFPPAATWGESILLGFHGALEFIVSPLDCHLITCRLSIFSPSSASMGFTPSRLMRHVTELQHSIHQGMGMRGGRLGIPWSHCESMYSFAARTPENWGNGRISAAGKIPGKRVAKYTFAERRTQKLNKHGVM